jgi:hypothetical protein
MVKSKQPMRSLLVVGADHLRQHRRQVPLVQHDQVVQALASYVSITCSPMALAVGACIGSNGVDADAAGMLAEVAAIDAIVITERMTR